MIPGLGRSTGEGIGYLLEYSWVFLVAQKVKNLPAMQETLIWFLGWEDPLEKDRLPTPVFLGFPCGSAGEESTWVRKIPWRREKATYSSILA